MYGGEYRDIKRRVKAAGRHAPVPILPGLVPYVAATVAEAQAKQQELDSLLPVAASLRQFLQKVDKRRTRFVHDLPPAAPPAAARPAWSL